MLHSQNPVSDRHLRDSVRNLLPLYLLRGVYQSIMRYIIPGLEPQQTSWVGGIGRLGSLIRRFWIQICIC